MKRETERIQRLRADHIAQALLWNPEELVFLDECGINLAMRQTYGWGPSGHRVVGTRLVHRGKNLTVVGAISTRGPIAITPWPGSLDGAGFLTWLEDVLLPKLRRGQKVLMDNLRVHKVAGVLDLFEKAGITVVFLPPYSPDLNPIEECWSKVKHWIRRIGPRGTDELQDALAMATERVTSEDTRGWYAHAGYAPSN